MTTEFLIKKLEDIQNELELVGYTLKASKIRPSYSEAHNQEAIANLLDARRNINLCIHNLKNYQV